MNKWLLLLLLSLPLAAQTTITHGSGTPSAGTCNAARQYGRVYMDISTTPPDIYGCGTVGWQKQSSGGASPAGSTGQKQVYATSSTFGGVASDIQAESFGCVGDNSTDNSTCMTNALAALNTAHGGILHFGPGTFKVSSQITLPNYDATTPAHHYPFRVTGVESYFAWNGAATSKESGTILSLSYSGTNGGQIYGAGSGSLELDHLQITSPASPTTTWSINGGNLTSIVVSSNVGTVTTAAQTLVLGNYVQILGSTTAALNGTYPLLAATDSTHFTITTSGVADATYNNAGMSVGFTTPMIYLTNTQPIFHDLRIVGDATLGSNTNNQDAFVFGGGTDASNNNTVNSGFSGFAGSVERVSVDYIRRIVYARNGAQQLDIGHIYENPTTTGSNDTVDGAAIQEATQGGNNYYHHNILAGQYQHAFYVITSGGTFIANSGGDNCCVSPKTFYRFTAAANSNTVIGNAFVGSSTNLDSGGGNLLIFPGIGNSPAPRILTNNAIMGVGQTGAYFLYNNLGGHYPALYSDGVTPGSTNYALAAGNGGDTYLNGTSDVYYGIGGSLKGHMTSALMSWTIPIQPTAYNTATNCSNAASPAVCGSAAAGAVAIPTGVTTVALVVNTTAVTANSEITLQSDDSLTIAATTCNNTLATLVGGLAVTARTAGTSFTITYNGTIATNPLCVAYKITN